MTIRADSRPNLNPRIAPKMFFSTTIFEILTQPTEASKVVDNTVFSSPEKAGVGGSTPSLATIILKNLAESRLALPVRSQSAVIWPDPVRFLATVMVKDLKSDYLSLSPLSVRFRLRRC